eukprot:298351_1
MVQIMESITSQLEQLSVKIYVYQLLGDRLASNAWHLKVQLLGSRHQKIIEEGPIINVLLGAMASGQKQLNEMEDKAMATKQNNVAGGPAVVNERSSSNCEGQHERTQAICGSHT